MATRVLGQTGGRRRRRFLLAPIVLVLLLALLVISSASGVLPGSPSSFESGNDPTLGLGNMVVTTAGNTDWESVVGEAGYVHLPDTAASNSDDSFTPGSKQDEVCPTIEGHKNPPKDDFTDVASFTEKNATTGDVYLYGATIRYASNGNASENIELKQGTSGECAGSPGLLERTPGDKLIAIDYLGGGSAPEFHVLTWVASGPCFVSNHPAPCWGATVLELDPAEAEGGVNASPITAADNPISGVALKAGQFAEFGVNLSDADIIPPGACKGFSQTIWESRSAGSSFVSSTKDISIDNHDINTCASVTVTKVGSDGGSQAGAEFTLYEGADTTGTPVGTCTVDAAGDCVNDDGTTDFPPSFAELQPGQYTIDETVVPAGYDPDPDLPFTFTLAESQNLELEFTDILQTGAITIVKTAKHADPNSSPNLVAGFTVTDSDDGTHTTSTDADGNACVDGLPPGEATVSETGPPAGYSAGPDVTVTVAGNTTCTNADGVVASFENIPLTDLTVSVDSQVDGGTASTITCGSEPTATTDPDGDGSLTLTNLEPNDPDGIVCTIVIDP